VGARLASQPARQILALPASSSDRRSGVCRARGGTRCRSIRRTARDDWSVCVRPQSDATLRVVLLVLLGIRPSKCLGLRGRRHGPPLFRGTGGVGRGRGSATTIGGAWIAYRLGVGPGCAAPPWHRPSIRPRVYSSRRAAARVAKWGDGSSAAERAISDRLRRRRIIQRALQRSHTSPVRDTKPQRGIEAIGRALEHIHLGGRCSDSAAACRSSAPWRNCSSMRRAASAERPRSPQPVDSDG